MVKQIVERIRNKDQRAMSELYQMYIGELSSVCYRYIPNADDAKDVLQNSFVKIFTAIPTMEYRSDEAFKGWLMRVVANEALMFLRTKKKLLFVEQDEIKQKQADIADDTPATEQISADQLHQLISELPDGYRTVLNLYVFEDYSHRQIAELLGIKESTSASQLHYAKQWLARRIKEIIIDKE
ncbi:MAG: sigma-70 family RNA polymerase sigma factor [Prevotella ruminicola]|jgi:RNA polymerase sigma-70 factor (ECF subfamily)|uniref:Sigma-70 family RNA polymerase sigma factor n=1 Tax=Xylanibacter ruminicola TaxID=839 RepID=A0A9D5S8H1_XYLRU|nr:sigma-70 family RNA polymerase sigma factor [Xylanibacter ruminicola]